MKKDPLFQMKQSAYFPFIPGASPIANGMLFVLITPEKECTLHLYEKGGQQACISVDFPDTNRYGELIYMALEGSDWEKFEYDYEINGKHVPDPYGKVFTKGCVWGEIRPDSYSPRCLFSVEEFDWEGDSPPQIPYEESILYHLHVRGFTMHSSFKSQCKGTFRAVTGQIPYLKDLGITAVELMPIVEFEEVIYPDRVSGSSHNKAEPTGKLNYWGYGDAFYFAPKSAYTSRQADSPVREFKELVKAFHREGIEVILELYIGSKVSSVMLLDILRYWVIEYHIDGIHLLGDCFSEILASDPILASVKLMAENWDGVNTGSKRHLAVYDEGYLRDIRKYLKGDENQLHSFIYRLEQNPSDFGIINYISNTNGFTMMDLVSYDRKHNEANGEENKDGPLFNYSWNCGAEGGTRSKKIQNLRRQQIRNGFLMLLFSRGTPLLLAGDEFGNSQGGNNNAYCHDSEISWLNWNLKEKNQDIYSFVKGLIQFRKEHPIFYMSKEGRELDSFAYEQPNISYHGKSAWRPDLEVYSRQIGVFYCGAYGKKKDGTVEDDFYVLYNMHWESSEFALPICRKNYKWYLMIDTDKGDIYKAGKEFLLDGEKSCILPPRSIWVLRGRLYGS